MDVRVGLQQFRCRLSFFLDNHRLGRLPFFGEASSTHYAPPTTLFLAEIHRGVPSFWTLPLHFSNSTIIRGLNVKRFDFK